jgi:hypothetical protein
MENRARMSQWNDPHNMLDLSLKKMIIPNTPGPEPSAFQPVDPRGFLEPGLFMRIASQFAAHVRP